MDTATALVKLKKAEPQLWLNPRLESAETVLPTLPLQFEDMTAAAERLERCAPLLVELFPELAATAGIIESELRSIDRMADWMNRQADGRLAGRILVKTDGELPVAGSIKARGGIYEVLLLAENLAIQEGLLAPGEDLLALGRPRARDLYQGYTVSVGSTGNLGLSVGITAAALGFRAVVHMSREAKTWKKERLRDRNVRVIEHAADYSAAVAAGREAARGNPAVHFVDDENSQALFLGYSTAALRLKTQLAQAGIQAGRDHPLFVYLPCGVGGAPGGIAFGLKHVFGDAVHCFFAEPVQAPGMLLGLLSGFSPPRPVETVGLRLKTVADGLAVGRASGHAGSMMRNLVSGVYTLDDDSLLCFLQALYRTENLRIEPSAAAGFAGPFFLCCTPPGTGWLNAKRLAERMAAATHLVWTTGGSLLPDAEFEALAARGARAALAFLEKDEP